MNSRWKYSNMGMCLPQVLMCCQSWTGGSPVKMIESNYLLSKSPFFG